MRHHLPKLLVLCSFFVVGVALAQSTCSALYEEVIASAGENCGELGRNSVCYGNYQVEASFVSDVPDDFFTKASDVAEIADLERIVTAGLDDEAGVWGVAVMNLQANVPNTLPGQNVTFVLIGDVEVQNAVAPEDAFVPSNGIALTIAITAGANIRSGPGTNYNVLGGAIYRTDVQADGISPDGDWLRVAFNNRVGWISRTVVEDRPEINDLPTITSELRTPMQAFYLRTGVGEAACEDVPNDVLLVQAPERIDVEITVNGVDIGVGSTGALRTVNIDGQLFLEIVVFDGTFTIQADENNPNDVVIRPGYRSILCLDEQSTASENVNRNLTVSCGASTPERVETNIFGADWCQLEEIPSDILNYDIEILCPGESPPAPANTGGGSGAGGGSNSQIEGVDCSSFGIIGPTSGITPRPTTFSWTPAPGATDYEIVFYGDAGFAGSFVTQSTSITVNVGQVPTGNSVSWEVRAYQSGAYACVSQRTQPSAREADPNPPPPPPTPYAANSFDDYATLYETNGENGFGLGLFYFGIVISGFGLLRRKMRY